MRIENRFAAISYYDQISHNIILPSPPPPKKRARIGRRSVKKNASIPRNIFAKRRNHRMWVTSKEKIREKTKVFLVSQFEEKHFPPFLLLSDSSKNESRSNLPNYFFQVHHVCCCCSKKSFLLRFGAGCSMTHTSPLFPSCTQRRASYFPPSSSSSSFKRANLGTGPPEGRKGKRKNLDFIFLQGGMVGSARRGGVGKAFKKSLLAVFPVKSDIPTGQHSILLFAAYSSLSRKHFWILLHNFFKTLAKKCVRKT